MSYLLFGYQTTGKRFYFTVRASFTAS
jgi:hypothetical protein